MAVLRLNGFDVLVDERDLPTLRRYRWRLQWATGEGKRPRPYVVTGRSGSRRKPFQIMQRVIMAPPEGMVVDHISGNTLDNRRENLRICTPKQNLMNRRRYRKCASKFKGININRGRICAQIGGSGTKYLGSYKTERAAARAYDAAARIIFGPFACLNFPNETIGPEAIHPRHRHKPQPVFQEAA